MNQEFLTMLDSLSERGFLRYRTSKPLSECASFRIGGPVDYAIYPTSVEGLINAITSAKKARIEYRVMGYCSNILFSDEGFRGAIIFLTSMNKVEVNESELIAEAGASLASVTTKACIAGLSGIEGLFGIPGSVGGAVYMNAGAYDYQVSDTLVESTWLDPQTGVIGVLSSDGHHFGYRRSEYMANGKIILSARFLLKKDDPTEIRARMDDFMGRRRSKQPLEYPSAGSVFKRYPGYFIGELIEKAGLKGYTVGGAQISEKHAGFIINIGGATALDVKQLVDYIIGVIRETNGITIERELIYFE